MSNDVGKVFDDGTESPALASLRKALAKKTKYEAKAVAAEWKRMEASKDEARIYSFIGPVGVASVQLCMDTIGQWAREDAKRPIRIVFNSPGGSVMDGLALYDYIQEIKDTYGTTIDTVALGTAASMAAVLLQAGDKRVIGKHAYLMVHEVSGESIGSMSEIQDQAKFTERLQNQLLDILAERTKLPRKEIKDKWERKEWWIDATEALELGFCDEIQ